MPVPPHLAPSWIKRRKIWIVLDCRCEICGEEFQLDQLIFHYVSARHVCGFEVNQLVEESILLLCPLCHHEIHTRQISIEEQLKIVSSRPSKIREQLGRILSYHPKPYTPPDTDLEQLYQEAKQVTQLIFGV